jgi:glycine/D-amino acid oxidase-like deaminating enzyme
MPVTAFKNAPLVGRNQPIFCPVPHSVTGLFFACGFLRAGFCMQILVGNGSFFEK